MTTFLHLRFAVRSLGAAVILLLAFTQSFARDFDFTYPHNPNYHGFFQADVQLMTARNHSSSRITLNAKTEGDASFSVYPFPVDSGQGPVNYYFMVYYRPIFGDTISGRLIIWDSTGADTVQLYGYDPSKPLSSSHEEFRLYSKSLTVGTLDDTARGYVLIYNEIDSAISVSLSLTSTGGWGFQGGSNPSPIAIPQGSNRYAWLHYAATGHPRDTAWVMISCAHPFLQYDTAMIVVTPSNTIDSTLTSRLTISTPYLGPVAVGDSDCATVSLVNNTAEPITITKAERHWTNDDYSYTLPTLPVRIAGHDSITITACFHPQSYHVGVLDEINWSIRDSAGRYAVQTSRVVGQEYYCMTMSPAGPIDIGTILIGGYVEKTVTITNENSRGGLVKLFRYYGTTAWSIPTFPNVFPMTSKATHDVTIRFAPVQAGLDSTIFVPSFDSDCSGYYTFYGHGVTDASDSLAFNAPEKGMLAFRTDSSDITRTFYFRNTSANTIRVTALGFVQGTHFQITGITPHAIPDTLASGAVLAVDVEFQGDTNGFYRDTLLITTESGLLASGFDVQAVRQSPAAVRAQSQRVTPLMTLQPMPIEQNLTLTMTDVQLVHYEIFDLLGDEIVTITSTGHSVWSATDAPAGTYIVRATGVDANGYPFIVSKRFIKK